MERNFYTDDFERLIRQKADQYKMYPSDQVWKGVYKSLHGRTRWRWAGLAILLLSIGLYTGNWYLTGKPASKLANNIQPSLSAANLFPGAPSAAQRWITPAVNTSGHRTIAANSNKRTNTQPGAGNGNTVFSTDITTDNGTPVFSIENSQVIISGTQDWRNPLFNGTETLTEKPSIDIKTVQEQAASNAEKALSTFADASSE